MDLAIGAKRVFVMMELLSKTGECKLVRRCTYPITALKCVSRVYTDLAVFDITEDTPVVIEAAEGLCVHELERMTGLALCGRPALG